MAVCVVAAVRVLPADTRHTERGGNFPLIARPAMSARMRMELKKFVNDAHALLETKDASWWE